jgi:hypothetical protein
MLSVRDPPVLNRRPDREHSAWHSLSRDVDDLAEWSAKSDESAKRRKEPEVPKAKPEGRS